MSNRSEKEFAAFVLRWAGKIPPIFWVTMNNPELEILNKWQEAGWWNHTSSKRSGWVTKEGFKALEEITK